MHFKPIKETFGFLVSRVCRGLRGRVHSRLHDLGLYRGQHFILGALWEHEGIAQVKLAEKLGIQPATVTNSLQRMEKGGWIERRHDAEDQRVSRVYLTEAGRELQSQVEALLDEVDERLLAGFSEDELAQLRTYLCRLHENLEKTGEEET